MTLPNFLIIGAPRCGTTSLYYYSKQHPEIYMSPTKEPHFFSFMHEELNYNSPGNKKNKHITHFKEYVKLFEGVSNEKAIGEASTSYLYVPRAAKRIKKFIPNVKLIAILRNPVERAYSHFLLHVRGGGEPYVDFAKAINEEEKRKKNNWKPFWFYKEIGYYCKHLKRYYDLFDKKQLKVVIFEEFIDNPLKIVKEIYQFLGVDDSFVPNISKYNKTDKVPKRGKIYSLIFEQNRIKSLTKIFLPSMFRKYAAGKLSTLDKAKNQHFRKKPVNN